MVVTPRKSMLDDSWDANLSWSSRTPGADKDQTSSAPCATGDAEFASHLNSIEQAFRPYPLSRSTVASGSLNGGNPLSTVMFMDVFAQRKRIRFHRTMQRP